MVKTQGVVDLTPDEPCVVSGLQAVLYRMTDRHEGDVIDVEFVAVKDRSDEVLIH